jgi:hypothetical protein
MWWCGMNNGRRENENPGITILVIFVLVLAGVLIYSSLTGSKIGEIVMENASMIAFYVAIFALIVGGLYIILKRPQ